MLQEDQMADLLEDARRYEKWWIEAQAAGDSNAAASLGAVVLALRHVYEVVSDS